MTLALDPSTADLIAESFDACPDGLAVLDEAGTVLFANSAYRRINPLVEPWASSRQPGAREELGMVEIDDDERWYRVTERPLSNGRRMRELADVTEQKRREGEIIAMQMRVRESLEALEEGFALFDADDRLLMVNSRYRAIFSSIPDIIRPGAPFEELIRVAAERRQNVEALDDPAGWVAERLKCHRAAEGRFEHHFSDGRWIMVTERKTADGCTIGTYSDITELKRREELLQATVDNVAEAILVLDGELGISALNRRALAMFSSESDRAAATERLQTFIAEHLVSELRRRPAEPLVLEHQTDADKTVEVRPRPMPDGGFVVTFSDITERKAAAERLHQSQKLEALGHLAGGVAHEFNNLLTAIGGFAKMAVRRPELSGFVRDCLDEIIASSDRAANLTRQMLTFGRKQQFDMQIVDPGETVRGLDRMLRSLVPETIELQFDIADGEAAVEADPSQLAQAILNLVLNARDAMPDGGHITVGTRVGPVPAIAAATEKGLAGRVAVMIYVADDGSGISRDVLPHIFEPFFTTKEQGKGTGLGLAVVYSIIERSGGIIDLATEPRRGTTFSIYLPAVEGRPDRKVPRMQWPRGNAERILVVEDEPGVRNLAFAALTQSGFRCFKAADAADALKALERLRQPPDLLLTDIVMPGKNGYQLASELRRRHPAIKIIYMSGYPGRAEHSGPEAPFIAKPFPPEELVAFVRRVLDAREPLPDPPLRAAG